MVWSVLLAAMAIVIAGLGSRLFPAHPPLPLARDFSGYRLEYPLGYWNAFGALAGMAAVLAAGIAADRRTAAALRGVAGAASVIAIAAMYLSLSRGAWLAVAAGAAVLLWATPNRGALLVSLFVIGLAVVSSLLLLRSYPALVDNPYAGRGEAAAGRAYLPWLVGLAAAAGAAQVGLAYAERRIRSVPALALAGRRATVLVLGLAAAALVVGYAANHASVDRFVSRQWQQFEHPTLVPHGTARLTTASTTRGDMYRVAVAEFAAHPVVGAGGGSFPSAWYQRRQVGDNLRNAHSLYLETLAELGLVGLTLLILFLGATLWAGIRSRRRPVALSRPQTAAVLAAGVVWIVHAGVDWDWQEMAFSGLAICLVATLFPLGRRRARLAGRTRSAVLWSLAGLCAAAAVYLWLSGAQAQRLQDANRLGARGNYAAALHEARAVSWSPASDEALLTQAYALEDLGRLSAAYAMYSRAAQADPRNWIIRSDWGNALAEGRHFKAARKQLRLALDLNPKLALPLELARIAR
jgi:tetratricopeptide (TPR) repeat protein